MKHQSETALSTMKVKVIAWAHSCRDFLQIIEMVPSLGDAINLPKDLATMQVSVHEDNAGGLILAKIVPPQYTHQSKHYAVKTILFHEKIVKQGS